MVRGERGELDSSENDGKLQESRKEIENKMATNYQSLWKLSKRRLSNALV